MIKKGSKIARYPWDQWFLPGCNGGFTIKKGTHFKCLTSTMIVQIRRQASLRNLKCSISQLSSKNNDGNTLRVCYEQKTKRRSR